MTLGKWGERRGIGKFIRSFNNQCRFVSKLKVQSKGDVEACKIGRVDGDGGEGAVLSMPYNTT